MGHCGDEENVYKGGGWYMYMHIRFQLTIRVIRITLHSIMVNLHGLTQINDLA